MPTYKHPETGEVIEDPSGGLAEFYLGRGFVQVGAAPTVEFSEASTLAEVGPFKGYDDAVKDAKKGKS